MAEISRDIDAVTLFHGHRIRLRQQVIKNADLHDRHGRAVLAQHFAHAWIVADEQIRFGHPLFVEIGVGVAA